jgi:CDP-diglyceride synthetase
VGRIASVIARYFEGAPLQPITPGKGLRGAAIAAVFTLIIATLVPALRAEGAGIGMVFVGAFVGIVVNDAGLSMRTHPKQTVAVIAGVSFVLLTIAALTRGILHLSTI